LAFEINIRQAKSGQWEEQIVLFPDHCAHKFITNGKWRSVPACGKTQLTFEKEPTAARGFRPALEMSLT
jgi:hypothetical protein